MSFRAAPAAPEAIEDPSPWNKSDLSGSLGDVTRRVIAEVERRKLELALKEATGNLGRAAELLQVSHKTLLSKLREHGIAES